MRLNAPLLTFLAITRLKPDQFTCQKYAKNLIIYKSFMIVGVWFVGNPYLGITSGLHVIQPRSCEHSLLDKLGERRYLLLDAQGEVMQKQIDLLQGTLDMLILKAVSLGPLHGYGILLRIQQISKDRLEIQQGSLYPALYRLEHQGWIASEWGESENKRKAKYYRLTSAGKRRFQSEAEKWNRMTDVIAGILGTKQEEV
jgi:PadR family transcriptional regulator PadR